MADWLLGLDTNVIRRSKGFVPAPDMPPPQHAGPREKRYAARVALARSRTPPVILGDTMGELRKFYSLADVVIVGRTLVDLGEKQHGSDMIEPAALGKPVVVGPYTGNFAEPMRALREAGAIAEVAAPDPERATSVEPLVERIDQWLRDPAAAAEVGRRAREVVVASQGATAKHVEAIQLRLATPRRGVGLALR